MKRIVLVAALLGLGLAPLAAAQQEPETFVIGQPYWPGTVAFAIAANEIDVVVVVRDSRGDVVGNPQGSDCELLREGERQPFNSFHVEHAAEASTKATAAGAAAVTPLQPQAAALFFRSQFDVGGWLHRGSSGSGAFGGAGAAGGSGCRCIHRLGHLRPELCK